MNMNSNCYCNSNPCQCHTTCKPPVACIPSNPPVRPRPPTITIQGLLELIESKCDKATCGILQIEMDLLFLLLGLEDHRPTKPGTGGPGTNPPVTKPLPQVALQLVVNMVESLSGDLKDKYPSATLLKTQLKMLWECMYNKQEHHGMWTDNFTTRVVTPTNDNCLLDGGPDTAPKTIKVITPVDVGSTIFNMIEGKKCLFESLVNNNTTEPTKLSVLQGKWINYCDVKAAIDMLMPRTIITDCKKKCDDPNHDGVHEGTTLLAKVTTNTANIAKNATNIATNAHNIASNTSKIHDLDAKITKCCVKPVIVDSDGHTFQAETKPGNINGAAHFIRAGHITIPAGTPKAVYMVSASNAMYAHSSSGAPIHGSGALPSSAYMGFYINVNGKRVGRLAWANDRDSIYKGDIADLVAVGSQHLTLNGGDILTMEVEYGDHAEQSLPPIGHFDFKADSAYIDIMHIKTV